MVPMRLFIALSSLSVALAVGACAPAPTAAPAQAPAAPDNIAAAGTAADKMASLIGDEGEVGVIVHDQTSRTGIDRRDGFVNQMKSKHPKVNIVDIQYGGGDQLKSTDLAKAMMQAHPNLKGFFGANEGSIVGVLNAVKELNKQGKLT